MKRSKPFSIKLILIIAFFLIVIVGIGMYFYNGFRFLIYVNQPNGIQMAYPVDWSVKENINGATVIFYSPLENELDFFKENINLVIQDISKHPMTLEEYSKIAVDQMKLVFEKNMKIEELSDTTLDGLRAKKLVFIGKGPQADLKYMSVWAIDGTTVYQLTYLAIASQYNQYLLKIKYMLSTFHRIKTS